MLAPKTAYPASHNLSTNYRRTTQGSYSTSFASPTDSEFSDAGYDGGMDSVRNWDENRVGDWLRTINAEQYIDLFRENNITGENLMDIDQAVLKEMGIKKIGDRVRMASQAKVFRHQEYRRTRTSNRDSFAQLDHTAHTPPSSGSPRGPRSARSSQGLRDKKPEVAYATAIQYTSARTTSRPASPFNEMDGRNRSQRYQGVSPREATNREPLGTAPNRTPTEAVQTARLGSFPKMVDTPQTSRFNATSNSSSALPLDKPWIRVIFDNAQSSVVQVDGCKSAEDIILRTLKKGNLNQGHYKSYTFYVLDGTEPKSSSCRRLSDAELLRVCSDRTRTERERLIFRKIHAGEPDGAQLTVAANLAVPSNQRGVNDNSTRSQLKLQKLTGESLPPLSYPMSPASIAERERHLYSAAQDLERAEEPRPIPRPRARKMKEFSGGRPPSELVVADPDTYFPDVQKEDIERTVRMSIRRSQRLSRATSRLSVASNFSIASSLRDAPPVPALPAISDAWLNGGIQARPQARPLSIVRHNFRPISTYSMAESTLEPLNEESPTQTEPDRQSFVSMDESSLISDTSATAVNITDPDGKTISSYFNDSQARRANAASTLGDAASSHAGSFTEQISAALAEDGEEPDDELNDFLQSDSWDNVKYIRGKLIGQGSFGSVYLALHAITGELMAVKQVELPSTAGTAIDAKKNNMVEALKREIALLRELKHPHIVQYLGSSSDANNLNIFLEYIPGGSIAKMLVDYGSFHENLVGNFVRQILVGLAYLHSKDIIHRDIKGANILVDNHGAVKISDFGISKRVQDSKNLLTTPGSSSTGKGLRSPPSSSLAARPVSLQGSVFWMAPEVVKQTAYTRKADIWSLGCLIVEMLTGGHPHPNCTQLQAIFKIGGRGAGGSVTDPAPEIPAHVSRDAKDFLRATFRIEYETRPEAEELLEFPFLTARTGPA